MKSSFLAFASISIILLAVSCAEKSSPVPEGILERDKMINVLVDVYLVDAMLHEIRLHPGQKTDTSLYYYSAIYEKHGITKTQIDSSLFYYNKNPKRLKEMYDKILDELNRRLKEVELPLDSADQMEE